jgi:2-polyprenyl-3-methyl-5-hydroxy-6-metoxy-1,4-benzoquinol methylase
MRGREFDPGQSEWMDRVQPVSGELETDLLNLAAINRRFGGQAIWQHFLVRWIRPGRRYRLLDLATGGGDGPRFMVDFAREIGATVAITAVDSQPSTLALARKWSANYPEIEFREGDVRAPEIADRTPFDFSFCSLALHHFAEPDAVTILRNLAELGRRGAMAGDLSRGFVCSAGAWLVTATLYRAAMTKHDARMSARRAYSFGEFARLADTAGWRNFGHERFSYGRQAIWLESADAI